MKLHTTDESIERVNLYLLRSLTSNFIVNIVFITILFVEDKQVIGYSLDNENNATMI